MNSQHEDLLIDMQKLLYVVNVCAKKISNEMNCCTYSARNYLLKTCSYIDHSEDSLK